ncbi:hypothetical protein M3Y99_01701200 [Aphelenchoides fujianensis]|nr:hypothetical protein M3Y99_01701200 [Aphelenchoides fujianensis]
MHSHGATVAFAWRDGCRRPLLNPECRWQLARFAVREEVDAEWLRSARFVRLAFTSQIYREVARMLCAGMSVKLVDYAELAELSLRREDRIKLEFFHHVAVHVLRFLRPPNFALSGIFAENAITEVYAQDCGDPTELEIDARSSLAASRRILAAVSSSLRRLRCRVDVLEDFLRRPLDLDEFTAIGHPSLSIIFKAVRATRIDLGPKLITDYDETFYDDPRIPVNPDLEHLSVSAEYKHRGQLLELLAAVKPKAPNLSTFEVNFFARADRAAPDLWRFSLNRLLVSMREFCATFTGAIPQLLLNFYVVEHAAQRLAAVQRRGFFEFPAKVVGQTDSHGKPVVWVRLDHEFCTIRLRIGHYCTRGVNLTWLPRA